MEEEKSGADVLLARETNKAQEQILDGGMMKCTWV